MTSPDSPITDQAGGNEVKGPVSLTPAAAGKIRELLAGRGTPEHGLRIGVRGGGCSGNSYFLEFCESEDPGDHVLLSENVKLFVDPESATLLGGTQIDFVSGLMESGFKFSNSSACRSCSCGQSFSA
jgi:iron-sulfur cluster assembly protein